MAVKEPKYRVVEKFKGAGVVVFKTCIHEQKISWSVDKNEEGFALLGNIPWPDYIFKGVKDAIRSHLKSRR